MMTTVDAAVDLVMRQIWARFGVSMVDPIQLPPPAVMRKARDRRPIEIISESTWHCRHCQDADDGKPYTIQWINVPSSLGTQHLGRCRECGQQYVVCEED